MSKFIHLPATDSWVNMDRVSFVQKDRDNPESIVLRFTNVDVDGVDSMVVTMPENVAAVLAWLKKYQQT